MASTISYHEPALPQLLALLSFLYLLQVARQIADHLFAAGLLGEIALGVTYGSPLGGILERSWEETFLAIGYIGLILIVFEGGLDANLSVLVSNLPLAIISAAVGVLLPMAFSFALLSGGFGLPAMHAFSAGAALGSTSLGTTFFVLRAQSSDLDLAGTRIGTVLMGAALIDDIIALVLLSVVTALESSSSTALGWVIGRPIVASVTMAIVGPVLAFLVARPLFRSYGEKLLAKLGRNAELFLGVCVLSAFLAVAFYTHTTMLLGAFCAGLFLSALPSSNFDISFLRTFHALVGPLQEYIFAPLFFASIGTTIPFLSLWKGRIIWRGIVYSLLMALGKIVVGLCVLASDTVQRVHPPEPPSPLPSPPYPLRPVSNSPFGGDEKSPTPKSSRLHRLRFSLPGGESCPPAVLLGTALVARGEIGVLIAQVAYASSGDVLGEEAYLIAIWAIALCTIAGPIAFSQAVKRCGASVVAGKWGAARAS